MADEQKTAEKAPKKGGLGGVLGIVLPAIFAAGAAFGGAKLASGAAPTPKVEHAPPAKPPGPTLALDPFLVNTMDAQRGAHAMKMTLAIEFDEHAKEETLKPLVPRLRDAVLTYLRTLAYEDASDPARAEKTRSELLERVQKAGASSAQKVLVTDLVVQQ